MERKLTAILCADVYGYSRLMGDDEEATLRRLSAYRKIIDGLIENHRGRFVNSAGDSILAEFTSVVEAVNCAVEIQNALKAENVGLPLERQMEFRIGVNSGDVMVEGEQIYGDGVNVAARLESLADPGGICVSGVVYDQVRGKLALSYQDLGGQQVKNIAEPVRAWRLVLEGTPAARRPRGLQRRYWRSGVLSMAGLAITIGTIFLVQHLSLKPPRTSASIPPQKKSALPVPSIPSIAVLPFTNLSGDAQQQYFSDGISDQLISDLSRFPGLFVIARNSSFAYRGKAITEQQIGRDLGVKYVLEGSVRKAAGQLRIAVQLVDASSGTETWTARYDRSLKDIFVLQDQIVGKVVTTLGLLFKLDEMKVPRRGSLRPTDNLEAYDAFLRGLDYFWRSMKEDSANAQHWMEKAIELDPNFGEAYALLGWIHWVNAWNQWSENSHEDLQRAEELAHKALALDDSNADALALLSHIDWMQKRPDLAVADAERAVAINPNSAGAYQALCDALSNAMKPARSLPAAETAMRLDPARQDYYAYCAGIAYSQMGRYLDAIAVLKKNVAAYPNNLVAHLAMIWPYAQLGREEDARAEAAEIMRISPQFTVASLPGTANVAADKQWYAELHRAGLK